MVNNGKSNDNNYNICQFLIDFINDSFIKRVSSGIY